MNKLTILTLLIVVTLFGACSDPSSWYPSGMASLVDSHEVDDGSIKAVIVTLTLQNTGISAINRSTFTVQAQTNARLYWKTAIINTRILPGAKIKASVELPYASTVENLVESGVSIIDPFFE